MRLFCQPQLPPCAAHARLRRREGKVVELAPGGHRRSARLSWVAGGLEIAEQVRAGAAPRFDVVYAALGSGGMVAALWLVWRSGGGAVRGAVVLWPIASRTTVRWLAGRTESLLRRLHLPGGAAPPLPPRPALRIDGRWVGAGYAHPTPAAQAAIQRTAACGLYLEPTYTGKTMSALWRMPKPDVWTASACCSSIAITASICLTCGSAATRRTCPRGLRPDRRWAAIGGLALRAAALQQHPCGGCRRYWLRLPPTAKRVASTAAAACRSSVVGVSARCHAISASLLCGRVATSPR